MCNVSHTTGSGYTGKGNCLTGRMDGIRDGCCGCDAIVNCGTVWCCGHCRHCWPHINAVLINWSAHLSTIGQLSLVNVVWLILWWYRQQQTGRSLLASSNGRARARSYAMLIKCNVDRRSGRGLPHTHTVKALSRPPPPPPSLTASKKSSSFPEMV